MSSFAGRLLGLAVGYSLYGATLLLRGELPRASDPPSIQRLMWIWWLIFGGAMIIPFLFLHLTNPVIALECILASSRLSASSKNLGLRKFYKTF
jgi:hypothetical protein